MLKDKLNEINTKLQDVVNPLNQDELDALVAQLQPLFDLLVKKEKQTTPGTDVKPADQDKLIEKQGEVIVKDNTKVNVKTGDSANGLVSLIALFISAMGIFVLRKKIK